MDLTEKLLKAQVKYGLDKGWKHLPDDHYGKAMVETFVRMYNPKYTYPFKITDRENETYV